MEKERSVKAPWRRWGREGERKYLVCWRGWEGASPAVQPPVPEPSLLPGSPKTTQTPFLGAGRNILPLDAAATPVCSPVMMTYVKGSPSETYLMAAGRPSIVLCASCTFSHLTFMPAQGGTIFRTGNRRTERLSETPASSSK